MLTEIADPLHALSLARTALSDPAGLPSGEDLDDAPPTLAVAEQVRPAAIDYAVAQIDRAIGGLYFEPYDDPAREAGVTLSNLGRLVSSVIDGLEESGSHEPAVTSLLAAAAHLREARAILSSDGS